MSARWLRPAARLVLAIIALLCAQLAQAAITRIATTTQAQSNPVSSLAIAVPAGTAAGDLLLAQVAVRGGSGNTITPPAGWTQLLLDNRGTTIRQGVYYRLATAGEPADYSWSFSASNWAAGGMVSYRGADPIAPVHVSSTRNNAASTTVSTTNIATTLSDAQIVAFFGIARASGFSAAAPDISERYDASTAAGPEGITIMMADAQQQNAGTVSNRQATAADSADNIGQLVALKPAAVLRADYHFDECGYSGAAGQVLDDTGAFHATPRNGLNTSSPGLLVRFGNLDSYARWAQSAIPLTRDWSLSVWFNKPFVTTGSRYHVLASVAGGGDLLYLDRNANFRWGVYTTPDATDGALHFGTLANGWHHLVLIGRGATTYLYIDGVLRDQVNRKATGTLTYLGTSYDDVNSADARGFRAPIDEMMIWDYALDPAQIGAIYANQLAGNNWNGSARTAPGCFDHFRISHAGTAVNCRAEPVTFTVHNPAHLEAPLSAGSVVGITTSTGHGDWSLVTGLGTLTNLGNGAATYTSGGESGFVLALSNPYAETVNINVIAGSITETSGAEASEPAPGTDPNLVFDAAGLRFVDAAGDPIGTQVSGKTSGSYTLQAIRSTGCATPGICTGVCTALFAPGAAVPIDTAAECIDPSTCQPGAQVTLATGAETRAVPANNGGAVSSYQATSFLFGANGAAGFTLVYPDAGSIRLHARYALGGGNPVAGQSSPFVVRPFGFALTAAGNPGAADATGTKYRKAGETFGATLSAVVWSAADDADSDGIPDAGADLTDNAATPNFGRETIAETATIAHALLAPSGGDGGVLSGGGPIGGFTAGAANASLAFSEVGAIRLTAGLSDASYLGSGADVTGASGPVGRFHPDHFTLLAGSILTNRSDLPACADPFTYMDEPFRLDFTLEARNAADALTRNYRSDPLPAQNFGKLDLTQPASFDYGAASGATDLTARLDLASASTGSWVDGQGFVQAPITFRRSAAPDGPYPSLDLGIDPQDADGVRLASFDLVIGSANYRRVSTVSQRFGRLRMWNAYGTERLELPLRMQVEYYDGNGFVANAADGCSTFAASDIALDFPVNPRNQLAACETRVSLAGGLPANLTLSAPGTGNHGWTDLRLNLGVPASGNTCVGVSATPATSANKAYLRGNWGGGAWDKDPRARATFGIYRGASEFIFFRESY